MLYCNLVNDVSTITVKIAFRHGERTGTGIIKKQRIVKLGDVNQHSNILHSCVQPERGSKAKRVGTFW